MTTREWQNALYVRDRWQVNTRLTLDLGLRYEYYPLMTRADRGIERIEGANDLASTRALTSLNVLLGGVGGVPEDLGIKVSKSLFAPRLGAIYRLNDNTVFRTGYGITYNPLPFSRPLRGFYPLTLASEFSAVDPYGVATTFEQGIPDRRRTGRVVGPHPAAELVPDALADGRRLAQPDTVVERGGRAKASLRHHSRRRLRRNGQERRLCRLQRERVGRSGWRRRQPAVLRHSRPQRRCPALGTNHQVAL